MPDLVDLSNRVRPLLDRLFQLHPMLYGQRRADRQVSTGRPRADRAPRSRRSQERAKKRTTALVGVPVPGSADGDIAIIASKGAYAKNPAWLYNLRANRRRGLQIGRERRAVRAREATDEERERLFAEAIRIWRGYATYRERTQRTIPVVVLARRR